VIKPVLQDEAFLADVRAVREEMDALHVWWLGQSGFLVQWDEHRILFDPYLSDSLTKKYATTDKPHVRMTERVIAPEHLDFINIVTSSHNHTDHLDAETLAPIMQSGPIPPTLVVPEANRRFVADRLGVSPNVPMGIDAGKTINFDFCMITGIPAAHEQIDRDAEGRCVYLGYVLKIGPWTIYHSGDTVLYDGMVDLLRPYTVDLALLPINGTLPERRVAGNLDGPEAARLAHAIGAKCVIPCHYDMFAFNTASPDSFVAECERLGQPYRVLRAGERYKVSKAF
jgi:L-ascorbate metabolism protein UlaG (beta-lactamase superfamily)